MDDFPERGCSRVLRESLLILHSRGSRENPPAAGGKYFVCLFVCLFVRSFLGIQPVNLYFVCLFDDTKTPTSLYD